MISAIALPTSLAPRAGPGARKTTENAIGTSDSENEMASVRNSKWKTASSANAKANAAITTKPVHDGIVDEPRSGTVIMSGAVTAKMTVASAATATSGRTRRADGIKVEAPTAPSTLIPSSAARSVTHTPAHAESLTVTELVMELRPACARP